LAFGFGGGGGANNLGARLLRVERKINIANMIVQITKTTISVVIHVSKSTSKMGRLGAVVDMLANPLHVPLLVSISMDIRPDILALPSLGTVNSTSL